MHALAPVEAIERRLHRRLAEVRTADHRIAAEVRAIDRQPLDSTPELIAKLWPERTGMTAVETSLTAVRADVEPLAGNNHADDGLTARRLADAVSFALSMSAAVYFSVHEPGVGPANRSGALRIVAIDRNAGRALGLELSVSS